MDLKTASVNDVRLALLHCKNPTSFGQIAKQLQCTEQHVRKIVKTHGRLKQFHPSKYRQAIIAIIQRHLQEQSSYHDIS